MTAAHEDINLWHNLNAIKKHHARPIITTNITPESLYIFTGKKDLCFRQFRVIDITS